MKILDIYNQVLSCIFFALLGLQVKLLLDDLNAETIVFFRSFFGFLVMMILIYSQKKIQLFKTQNLKIHLLRSIFGTLAMYFGYSSLQYISLSEATSIGYTKVLFSSLMAIIFLKERINFHSLFLIFFGFLGVFLITLPTQETNLLGIYMSIFSAICVAGGIISISYLAKIENTLTVILYHSFISSCIFLFFFRDQINLDLKINFFYLLLLTFTALAGQYFNSESYKYGKTNKIAILSYTRIIFATFFGFIFLGENVKSFAILGIIIIAMTTYFIKAKSEKS